MIPHSHQAKPVKSIVKRNYSCKKHLYDNRYKIGNLILEVRGSISKYYLIYLFLSNSKKATEVFYKSNPIFMKSFGIKFPLFPL